MTPALALVLALVPGPVLAVWALVPALALVQALDPEPAVVQAEQVAQVTDVETGAA